MPAAQGTMKNVLMVAEKPSLAQSIARILSRGRMAALASGSFGVGAWALPPRQSGLPSSKAAPGPWSQVCLGTVGMDEALSP